MKKIYLLTGMMLAGSAVIAQRAVVSLPLKQFAIDKKYGDTHPVPAPASSADRVTLFSDDFSTPSNWNIITSGQGTFQIVTTTPTDQQTYMGAMASTTAANGFATFNGIQYLTPSATAAPQNTSVTNATAVDLTGYPAVTVDFQQRYRPFNTDQVFLEVSGDNGATWTSYELNTQYPVNASAIQNTISQNVSSAVGGQSQVLVRFTWINTSADAQYGSGYGWMVDDVQINTAPDNNLILVSSEFYDASSPTNWGYKIAYKQMAIDQIHAVEFSGTFENQGAATTTNSRMDVTVSDATPTVVFTGSTTPVSVPSLGSVTDSTTTTFTPSAMAGQFDIEYIATYDSIAQDISPANNESTGTMWVTTSEIGRDDNLYSNGGLWNGETGGVSDPFSIGPVIEAKASVDINRIRVAFASGTDAGVLACVQLYQVDASSGNFNLVADNCGTSQEKTLTSGDISSGSTITWVDFVICHSLVAGEFYIPVVNHYGGTEQMLVMTGGTAADQTVFLLDGTDNTWYYTTSVPKIRMVEGACDASVGTMIEKGFTLSQNIPNPANGTTVINYSLVEGGEVMFDVVDITGKIVSSVNLGNKNAGEYRISFEANSFAPGVYFYSMTVGGEKVTKRMIITE